MYSIFTHFLAAILPIVIFIIYRYFKGRSQFIHARKTFWERQRPEGLKYLQKIDRNAFPPPFNLIGELEKMQTAINTASIAVEMGLLTFIEENAAVTLEQIIDYLDFAPRPVRAAIEVLLALEVLQKADDRYSLTDRARLYLMQDSAFFESLPPATLARRFLTIAKKGRAKGAVKRWQKGKAQSPERWAIQQHKYSFPLGFALSRTGIIQNGQTILDVAGGSGALLIALAHEFPEVTLNLIELPGSVPIAQKMIQRYGMENRIQCFGMDMFTGQWPSPVDVVIFSNIFHDWSDEKCMILARKAHEALSPGGKILVIEALLHDDRPGPLWTAHWSMAMALFMEGRQFHGNELKTLLQKSGFPLVNIQPLLGYYSIVIGEKSDQH